MLITKNPKIEIRKIEFKKEILESVNRIFENVLKKGDRAVFGYTKKFDDVNLTKNNIQVTKDEIKSAYKKFSRDQINAIKEAIRNIERFCKIEKVYIRSFEFTFNNNVLGEVVIPIESVGCYIPSGRFPLPSTVLMSVIPAKIAGVKEIIICTPPVKRGNRIIANEAVVVAADILGVNKIYKVGGAQAIAAMAVGTEIIPKVDKIVGPGNAYVATAKKLAYGYVDIDFIAGPTELMIIADDTANPDFIAADLLAEAEHDIDAIAILVTSSVKLANKVNESIENRLKVLSTKGTAEESLGKNGKIIIVNNLEECFKIANKFAPEHLEVMVRKSEKYLNKIKNAGSIFLGNYSSSVFGDYVSGTNHILPTSGLARVRGGLSVRDFLKFTSFQKIDKKNIMKLIKPAYEIASLEGLDGHAKAVKIRSD